MTKIILYLFLGYICHKTRFVLGFLVAMLMLRPLIGGIHCRTYWGCFLFSLGLIIVGLVINENGKDHIVLIEILNTMLFFQAIKLGPAVSPFKRKQTDKEKQERQKATIWIQLFLFLLYLIFRKEEFGIGLLTGSTMELGQVVYLAVKLKLQRGG